MLSASTVLTYHGDLHWELPGVTGSRIGNGARCALETVKLPQYDKILTVSSDLGRRVRSRYGVFDIEPTTLYNGIDHTQFYPDGPGCPNCYDVGQPYILHVSNYSQKKNPRGILEGFERMHQAVGAELLICGGGWKESDEVARLIDTLGITDVVTLAGYVPDEDLSKLYRDAQVFLYPSLHESFGLPIIEAMACGTPVVTSDIYAPPEIAGEAAVTCDPNSPAEIAAGIQSILEDRKRATRLRKRGVERSKQFTWEYSASQLLNFYRTL
jgi:glycosyltransferase involved in cell wall biosynthesis